MSSESPSKDPVPASRGGFPESGREHQRYNYVWHTIEGGLYMGGMAFVADDMVLPNMVNEFGGPEWLISVTPLLKFVGIMAPQFVAAHWIERLDRMHPYTVLIGLFQRLSFLLGAVGLMVFGGSHPLLAMGLAVSAPLLSGLFSGVAAPAWQELVSRTVPPERRASLHALRNTIAAVLALLAGWMIHHVLQVYPGYPGYAMLFATTFVLTMLSWVGFRQLREIPQPDRANKQITTLTAKFREFPGLLKKDPRLRLMCFSSFFGPSIFIVVPFAAVYATEVTGRGTSFVGYLVIAKTIGMFAGNLLGGWLGDTRGGRLPLMLSRSFRVLFCIAIPFAQVEIVFLLIFCLYGMSFTLNMVGNQVLALEISPDGKRPTYLGIISGLTLPGLLMVPIVSTTVRQFSQEIWPLALLSLLGAVISLVALARISEPRVHYPS